MRMTGAIVVAFLCAAASPAGAEKARDLDRIQGVWQVVTLTERGKKVPEKETQDLEIVVAGDKLAIKEKGKTVTEYQIKLDETKKPRTLDMTITDGKEKGEVAPGIYALEGDMLTMCVDEDRKGRPSSFDEKDTKTCSVIALKRKK